MDTFRTSITLKLIPVSTQIHTIECKLTTFFFRRTYLDPFQINHTLTHQRLLGIESIFDVVKG